MVRDHEGMPGTFMAVDKRCGVEPPSGVDCLDCPFFTFFSLIITSSFSHLFFNGMGGEGQDGIHKIKDESRPD